MSELTHTCGLCCDTGWRPATEPDGAFMRVVERVKVPCDCYQGVRVAASFKTPETSPEPSPALDRAVATLCALVCVQEMRPYTGTGEDVEICGKPATRVFAPTRDAYCDLHAKLALVRVRAIRDDRARALAEADARIAALEGRPATAEDAHDLSPQAEAALAAGLRSAAMIPAACAVADAWAALPKPDRAWILCTDGDRRRVSTGLDALELATRESPLRKVRP